MDACLLGVSTRCGTLDKKGFLHTVFCCACLKGDAGVDVDVNVCFCQCGGQSLIVGVLELRDEDMLKGAKRGEWKVCLVRGARLCSCARFKA